MHRNDPPGGHHCPRRVAELGHNSLLPNSHATHLLTNTFSLATTITINNTDLEWKVLYVGSAHDSAKDQVLDEILVGPVPVGVNKFVLQADPPVPDSLPADDILGVTVVLVTCSYKEREFVRVGYYVNNEYTVPLAEGQVPPSYPALDMNSVQRQILADKPRVTKFPIPWGNEDVAVTAAAAADGTENATDNVMEENQDAAVQSKMEQMMEAPSTPATAEMDVE